MHGSSSPPRRTRSSSANDRLKRRILREVITDNVEVIHGFPRGFLARRRRQRLAVLRRLLLGMAAVAAVASAAGLWSLLQGHAVASSRTSGQRITVRALTWSDAAADPSALAQTLAERLAVGDRRNLVTEVVPLAVRRMNRLGKNGIGNQCILKR